MPGLAPIGLGTPWVESLSGLIVRTAAIHQTTPRRFMERLVAEGAARPGRMGETADELRSYAKGLLSKPSAAMNGGLGTARIWSETLGRLTLRRGIEQTTLIGWDDRIGARAALSDTRRYCPACLWDWHREDRPAYEPLRWQFQPLSSCIGHGLRLRSECPNPDCGASRGTTAGWAVAGMCLGCQRSLGQPAPDMLVREGEIGPDELDWAQYVDGQLGDIIARPPEPGEMRPCAFQEVLASRSDA